MAPIPSQPWIEMRKSWRVVAVEGFIALDFNYKFWFCCMSFSRWWRNLQQDHEAETWHHPQQNLPLPLSLKMGIVGATSSPQEFGSDWFSHNRCSWLVPMLLLLQSMLHPPLSRTLTVHGLCSSFSSSWLECRKLVGVDHEQKGLQRKLEALFLSNYIFGIGLSWPPIYG